MLRLRQAINEIRGNWTGSSARLISRELQRIAGDISAEGRSGLAAGRKYAEAVELTVSSCFEDLLGRPEAEGKPPSVDLFALGALGRRQLCTGDPIRLLLVEGSESPPPKEDIRRIQEVLSGTLEEAAIMVCIKDNEVTLSHSNTEQEAALLDIRRLAGYGGSQTVLSEQISFYFAKRGKAFIAELIERARERHQNQGDTVFRSQPDLVEAPGALKDIEIVQTVGKTLKHLEGGEHRLARHPLISSQDLDILDEAADLMLAMRFLLHQLAGTGRDTLTIDTSNTLAANMAVEKDTALTPGQVLMRIYYALAADVYRLLRVLTRTYEQVTARTRRKRADRRRNLENGFTAIQGALYSSDAGLFSGRDAALRMMHGFRLAQKARLSVAEELQKRVHDELWRVDEEFRRDPKAASEFMEILSSTGSVEPALRAMRDSGFLAVYVPEFGAVQGLVAGDPSHEYTVDEHTLLGIRRLDELACSGDEQNAFKRSLLQSVERPELLALAVLCHDLGKAKGPGHIERSAVLVPQITERLHLAEEDTRLVSLLVANHVLLSSTALTRDLGDEATINRLAETLGSADTLDYIYLLTCADGCSISGSSWPEWKDELLRVLYGQVRSALIEGGARFSPPGDFSERLLELLPPQMDRREALFHLEVVPTRYLVEVSPEEAVVHLDLVQQLREDRAAAVSFNINLPLVDWWVVTTDRPGRIAQIAGALAASSFNILSAQAYTRKDGVILDRFVTAPPRDRDVGDACSNAVETLEGVLSDDIDVRELIEEHRNRTPAGQTPGHSEALVFIDNRLSERYTVIDITGPDRVGFLYELSSRLLELGLDIQFARIAGSAGVATDVFFVTDSRGRKIEDDETRSRIQNALLETTRGGGDG